MKQILIVGAGRSASSLIEYLISKSKLNNWFVTIADYDVDLSKSKVTDSTCSKAIFFDVNDKAQCSLEVSKADIVVSMLPASMHIILAEECVNFSKNLVTASYVSDQIKALNEKAIENDIIILNEIGLDPGIDHMSAKKVIDDIKNKGGKITSFKSYCGGLVAPEYDNNPWNYKFTWNPRNVVLAGQSTASYISNGNYKYIPYQQLFSRITEIEVLDEGKFEAYANRDSLSYREIYDLPNIPTMLRGTLRKKGFCDAWDIFVQLGMTDDTYQLSGVEHLTWKSFINSFLDYDQSKSVEQKLAERFSTSNDVLNKLKWLGIFDDVNVNMKEGSPAQILQKLLESKLSLESNDKDMIVMQHLFEYELLGENKLLKSSLVLKGKDDLNTAMSMTVGLPVAIAVELILNNKIKSRGVLIPTDKEIYDPVLKKLEVFEIKFVEEEFKI
jgi:saccharopine dehydrogenase (NADP+, L-glutamate forming)